MCSRPFSSRHNVFTSLPYWNREEHGLVAMATPEQTQYKDSQVDGNSNGDPEILFRWRKGKSWILTGKSNYHFFLCRDFEVEDELKGIHYAASMRPSSLKK